MITGVASHWGAELARRLERDPSVEYLAGVDSTPPPVELERTDFIEADIRSDDRPDGSNPNQLLRRTESVRARQSLKVMLAPGGGVVAVFRPK